MSAGWKSARKAFTLKSYDRSHIESIRDRQEQRDP